MKTFLTAVFGVVGGLVCLALIAAFCGVLVALGIWSGAALLELLP